MVIDHVDVSDQWINQHKKSFWFIHHFYLMNLQLFAENTTAHINIMFVFVAAVVLNRLKPHFSVTYVKLLYIFSTVLWPWHKNE